METIDDEQFYTADEACARLGIKPATLYAYVSRGRLRSFRLGIRRRRLYRRDEVDALARLTPNRGMTLPLADPWGDIH
ncbi:MAG: helix-turn-helix domain-containing protein [Chloroflexota bacterium]